MSRREIKRQTDQQIISGWIRDGERVLDLGCGRGVLLEHLIRTRKIRALGVDSQLAKIQSCVKRGVPAYHGDADLLLAEFPDRFFDWVLISRTVQELQQPDQTIREALRVASNVAIGFVNQGFWLNRWSVLRTGSRPVNEVFPRTWDQSAPSNPVTINGFLDFTGRSRISIRHRVYLAGDWVREARWLPNLFAGYALFHLSSDAD